MNQEIVFSAKDLASGATLQVAASQQQLKTALDQASVSAGGMGRGANAVDKELNKLTSGSEFAAQGIQMMRGALNSIVWGTIIGAVSAATLKLIDYAVASDRASIDTEKLNSGVLSQAEKFGLLSKAQRELSQTTVDLFNAELELAQFRATRDSAARAEKIKQLEAETAAARQKNHEEGILLEQMQTGNPLILTTSVAIAKRAEKVLENAIAVAKLRGEDAAAIELLKLKKTTLQEVTTNTQKLTDAMKAQEQAGKSALQAAQLEARDKAATQETLGRSILEAAQLEARDRAAIEEQKGRDIQAAAVREYQIRVGNQEAIGAAIRDNAVREWETTQRYNELRVQSYADTASAIASIADALFAVSGSKSKALFNIVKAASAAEAIVKTYQAANQVLADPTLPYFAKGPAAAAIIAAGLANVARITSTQMGGGAVGGGGGGGTPIGSTPSRELREPEAGQRVELSLSVNALDPANVDWDAVFQEAGDALGRYLQRGGRTGPVQIEFKRN